MWPSGGSSSPVVPNLGCAPPLGGRQRSQGGREALDDLRPFLFYFIEKKMFRFICLVIIGRVYQQRFGGTDLIRIYILRFICNHILWLQIKCFLCLLQCIMMNIYKS